MASETLDVVIIGAGISGICAAYYLQRENPKASFVVLERRAQLGGTWDLFRYLGIRSDSDMYTFGFPFRRWTSDSKYGNGPDIVEYMNDTVAEFGIDKHVRYCQSVTRAAWDDQDRRWRLTVGQTHDEHTGVKPGVRPDPRAPAVVPGTEQTIVAQHIILCTGYYSYTDPYWPTFPNQEAFKGEIIHPQFWDPTFDYKGKSVAVIGSGATAITLVPNLAREAAKVYMVQRTPSYIAPLPGRSPIYDFVHKWLWFVPVFVASWLIRWLHVLESWLLFHVARRRPEHFKKEVFGGIKMVLGKDYDEFKPHFTPSYQPWDQRVCVAPQGDIFLALKSRKVEIVTDSIQQFTAHGIRLGSGRELKADIIVPATGLSLQFRGGIEIVVNGKTMTPTEFLSYRGVMFNNVPNLFAIAGYFNASWSMKASLIAEYAAKTIRYMANQKLDSVTPRAPPAVLAESGSALGHFTSGYLQRGEAQIPRHSKAHPWRVHQNYMLDLYALRWASKRGPDLEFTSTKDQPASASVKAKTA